ncbi:uncharacterized protein LOC127848731 [Dreissena polymorpha]|nr:uncharacterized protein LOC127848731 [Dreissena polymorpha]
MDEQRKMSNGSTLLEALYDQAIHREEFCDVTLKFGDKIMGAHWYVLVINSGYFQDMYASRLKEKKEGSIQITEGTREAIQAAIKYLYTGKVIIDDTHIDEILHIADYLQIRSLTDECNSYLVNKVRSPSTCLKVYKLAKCYKLNLLEDLLGYIAANLKETVDNSSDIQHMTNKDVDEFSIELQRHGASLEGRLVFYHKWLRYDVENRKEVFKQWFCKLNLQESTHEDFESLSKYHGLFQTIFKNCWEYYMETKILVFNCHLKMSLKTKVILALTIKDVNQLCVHAYIIDQNYWLFIDTLPVEFHPETLNDICMTVNETDNCIYVVDDSTYQRLGEEGTDSNNTCYVLLHKYDFMRKVWNKFEVNLNIKKQNLNEIKGIEWLNKKLCIVVKSWSPSGNYVILCQLENNKCCCNVSPLIELAANLDIETVDSCVVDDMYIVVNCCYFNKEGTLSESVAVEHICAGPTEPALYTFPREKIFHEQRFMFPTCRGVIRSGISSSRYMYLNVFLGLSSEIKEGLLPGFVLSPTGDVGEKNSAQDCIVHGASLNTVFIQNPIANKIYMFDFCSQSLPEIPSPPGKLHRSKFVSGFLCSSALLSPCPFCAFEQKVI